MAEERILVRTTVSNLEIIIDALETASSEYRGVDDVFVKQCDFLAEEFEKIVKAEKGEKK